MHQKTQRLSRSRSLLFPKNFKKLKFSLVPEAYISLKLEKTQKYNFFHIWQIQNLEQVYPV